MLALSTLREETSGVDEKAAASMGGIRGSALPFGRSKACV